MTGPSIRPSLASRRGGRRLGDSARGSLGAVLGLVLVVAQGMAASSPSVGSSPSQPAAGQPVATVPLAGTAQSGLETGDAPPGTAADPAPTPAVPVPAPATPDPSVGESPSLIAVEALAHAADRIAFSPGSAVTVPFTPRAGDGWPVDGGQPRALPAGAASGRAMAGSRQGSAWSSSSASPADDSAQASADGPARASAVGPAQASADASAQASAPAAFASVAVSRPRELIRPVDLPTVDLATTGQADSAMATVPAPSAAGGPAGSTADLRRQVIGFLPYWTLGDSSTTLDYGLLSTIAYFGVGVDASGNLTKRNADGSLTSGWAGWTSQDLTQVIDAAHHHGTRVVLTVQAFAWTSSQATTQSALLGSATARLNLAKQIAAAVRDRGADGVNLDFEPLTSGREAAFTAFVRTVRSQLDRIAKGYQLTFDTTGSIGNYPIEDATAPGAADAIFVMGYDYRTAAASSAGSISPLGGPAYDLTDTALSYLARVPAAKVIMGVPYYGRAWSTVSDKLDARTQTGTKYGSSSTVTYDNAADLAKKYGRRYDPVEQTPWVAYQRTNCSAKYGCVTTWREVYYEDAQSLKAKYDLINRFGLRGVGIWALGYDATRPELYKAIVGKFVHDTTPPDAGIDVLAPTQGDEGFAVSWSAVDLSPIRNYDVQVSADGGRWRTWLTRTSVTNATYLGTDGHAYAFRVRATDAKGNIGPWDIATLPDTTPSLGVGAFGVVKASSLTVRSAPDTSAAAIAKLASGDIVALTDGPVTADGFTWYEISGPLDTWAPTVPVRTDNWIAVRNGSTTYLTARTAPNSTVVDAGISDLAFTPGGLVGSGAPAAGSNRSFSPDGDGSQDGLTIHWTNNVALDSLTLKVYAVAGTAIGSRAVPATGRGAHAWSWDGKVGGATLPDGRYVLQLVGKAGSTVYSAPSARPTSPAQVAAFGVTIDTVAPTIAAVASPAQRFSPNGDGRADSVTLQTKSTGGGTHWRLTAAPMTGGAAGAAVRTIAGTGTGPRVSWNGRTDAGSVAPDGTYRLTMSEYDGAGNAASVAWLVALDTTPPHLTVPVPPIVFSPNGDGVADSATIGWTAAEPATAIVRIYHGSQLVRTLPVTRSATATGVRWNGRDSAGRAVPDGRYRVRIELTDAVGNHAVADAAIVVDRTAGWLGWSSASFFPQDGDALASSSRISFALTRAATTTLQIVDGSGAVVRTAWTGRRLPAGTAGWTWDGRIAGNVMAAPGTYSAVLTVVGSLGSTTLRRAVVADAFVVHPSAIVLHAGQTLTVTFTTVEGLRSRPVVTFSQAGRPPVSRTATLVSAGHYTVHFTVGTGGAGAAHLTISARDSGGRLNTGAWTVAVK